MSQKKPERECVFNKRGAKAFPLKTEVQKWLDAGWTKENPKAPKKEG